MASDASQVLGDQGNKGSGRWCVLSSDVKAEPQSFSWEFSHARGEFLHPEGPGGASADTFGGP